MEMVHSRRESARKEELRRRARWVGGCWTSYCRDGRRPGSRDEGRRHLLHCPRARQLGCGRRAVRFVAPAGGWRLRGAQAEHQRVRHGMQYMRRERTDTTTEFPGGELNRDRTSLAQTVFQAISTRKADRSICPE